MSVYDVLWKNVPENLKNNQFIDEYIQVISEVFDEIRYDINQQKYSKDYIKTDVVELNRLGNDFGIDFPRNVSEHIQRLFVRDANQVFARLGTRRSLEWALRILNITQFEISEVWAPNPDLLRGGYYKDIGVSGTSRYTISNLSYVDFYLGEEVVKTNGTFFEGCKYDDVDKENIVTDIPIFGETYKNYTQVDFTDTVAKTPYVIVRIFDDNFNELVQDYTDPDTGITYSYTAREKQQIVNQLIEYFVQILHRTANTKIIVVSEILYYIDEVPLIVDTLNLNAILDDVILNSDVQQIDDSYDTSSEIKTQLVETIGESIPIGKQPYYSVGEYTTHKIGLDQGPIPIDESAGQIPYNYDLYPSNINNEHYMYLDSGAQVVFTNNFPETTVTVESKENLFHSSDWTSVDTLNTGDSFNQTFSHLHCLRLSFSTTLTDTEIENSTETINIDISY